MRSCWKIPFINIKYFSKYFLKNRIFKIKFKNSIIGSNFKDKKVIIYNGKFSNTLDISSQMVGFKFGEFIPVKISTYYRHLKKSKKKSK